MGSPRGKQPSWLVSWELELEQARRRTRGKLRQGPELRLERVQAMRNPEGNAWNCCRSVAYWDGLGQWVEHPVSAPAPAVKGEGENKWCSLVLLTPGRVPPVFLPFGRYSRVSKWISFLCSLGAL